MTRCTVINMLNLSPKAIGQALIVESVTTTPDQLMELGLVLDICWGFVVYGKELKVL